MSFEPLAKLYCDGDYLAPEGPSKIAQDEILGKASSTSQSPGGAPEIAAKILKETERVFDRALTLLATCD